MTHNPSFSIWWSYLLAAAMFGFSAVGPALATDETIGVEVITPDQVPYVPLNPARGDASPQAGVLWGDIRNNVPSGVLLRFADGFSSPPHIHNITYRAVVISGQLHNDDPDAADLWMGPGSYWMQPAGEVHITAARKGSAATAFLEILEGPYLVQPGDQAFDNGERPVNVVDTNLVWMSAEDLDWIETPADRTSQTGPHVALLWGTTTPGALNGSFIKLPAGYRARLSSATGTLRSVIIEGQVDHYVPDRTAPAAIGPGGYFASDKDVSHVLTCAADATCLLYVRSFGRFTLE